jgi:hypothetical protein
MLAFALAAAMSSPAPPTALAAPPPDCRASGSRAIVQRAPLGRRKLGELPPGVLTLAVNKWVDGCPVSVLMQTGPDGRRIERALEDSARMRPAELGRQGRPERKR